MRFSIVTALCITTAGCASRFAGAPIVPIPTGPFAGASEIPLASGENLIDLDGDGRNDIVMLGWRENNNAHGHKTYSFYRTDPTNPAQPWQVVPFEDSVGLNDAIGSTEGADCTLADIRIVRSRDGHITVLRAERDFGESYADSALVTFKTFELARNPEHLAGFPDAYFKEVGRSRSRGKYCDVADAFAAEQGIPGKPTLR